MSKTSARHQALQEFLSARGYATIEELARLIGGAAVTPALRRSAEELLDQAEAVKKK